MDKSRRGFISKASAAGVGVFAYGVAQSSLAEEQRSSIGEDDLLIAMPGSIYYAIPQSDVQNYIVSENAFLAEQNRREADKPVMRGGGGRSAPMGVRG